MSSTRTTTTARGGKKRRGSENGRSNRKTSKDLFAGGIHDANWETWKSHLKKRPVVSLNQLLDTGKRSPLLWGLPSDFRESEAEQLIGRLNRVISGDGSKGHRSVVQGIEPWLVASADRVVHTAGALECLAWANALPCLTQTVELSNWQSILETLLTIVRDAEPSSGDCPLLTQLIVGELPLTLAYHFPEINECRALLGLARDTVSRGIADLTDGEGIPQARFLDIIRPMFASWTRCRYMGQRTETDCFDKESQLHYEWLVRQTLRLLRRDGTQVFDDTGSQSPRRLLRAALRSDGDRADHTMASRIMPGLVEGHKEMRSASLPEASAYSEWAQLALFRSDWEDKPQQFSVRFDDEIATELSTQGLLLWSGKCDPQVSIDGKLVEGPLEWSEMCWYSDVEADYLELEAELSGKWRVQRQFCFGRDDGFLLLSDVILGDREAEIEYCLNYPLAKGVEFHPARETYEGTIANGKKLCRVLPLAFPEWRIEPSPGSLTQTCDGLNLSLKAKGSALYAPLFFDLAPRRQKGPLTWRRLTVAHLLQIEADDQAVGYRVQSRDDQFFIYRSLAEAKNRTLLGQNLSEEFVCARFASDGTLEELIMIE